MDANDIAWAIDSGMKSGSDYLVERLRELLSDDDKDARIRELEGRLNKIADAALAVEKQVADTSRYRISKGKVLSTMQHIRKLAALRGGEDGENGKI